ncbi:sodium:calcium antiporter [Sulfitobacter alexandrii]|uniref:Sodium:calcium antiporter n=1 Tax=Sulfitobacter alexandrii TaxID=1917485 RepID=A0A1J0WI75_9RHOB|nr:calcium/sodium antiporter [Sulfitobacter alexandrii]APE43838.1 sodium:calcium antiporter [Sulfitobacter alexandrii]
MIDFLLIATGFAGLLLGGNWLVNCAVGLATRWGVSPLVIGLTLVGFGTSMPELVTSVQAALAGSAGIAMGNVIGSNIANILLILGLTCALSPIAVARGTLRRDGMVMLGATFATFALVLFGTVSRPMGLLLISGLALYLVSALRRGDDAASQEAEALAPPPLWRGALGLLLGLIVTILAARALVAGAVSVAAAWGVSEALIGVTIVAVGTSLPELVTSIIAARKGQADMAFGNIIGSNIFNVLGILGVTALVRPMEVPAQFASLDIWVMTAAALAVLFMGTTGRRISRGEGAALLAGYIAYTGLLIHG